MLQFFFEILTTGKRKDVENTLLSFEQHSAPRIIIFLRAGCSNGVELLELWNDVSRKAKESKGKWEFHLAGASLVTRPARRKRDPREDKNLVTPFGSSLVAITRLVPVHRVASRLPSVSKGGTLKIRRNIRLASSVLSFPISPLSCPYLLR